VNGCEERVMIVLTALVTVVLLVYLLAALLRPEWF
jgi:K+-transporting ATPase KdpF subunit